MRRKLLRGCWSRGLKRRPLLQTSSPASNEQPKPNSMARVSFKSVSPRGVTPGFQRGIGWHSFRHTVSAWGKEAGLQLEDVKTLLRHENIATTSDIYGDLGLEATDSAKADQFRQRAGSRHYSVKERDPYLSREPFGDCLQSAQKNGSSGRTRTYNPPVNSRMLCH